MVGGGREEAGNLQATILRNMHGNCSACAGVQDSGSGKGGFEPGEVAIVASTDDQVLRLCDSSQLWRVGRRTAVVRTDHQTAHRKQRQQLLLSGTFKVTWKAELMSGVAEYGSEAGFVIGGC